MKTKLMILLLLLAAFVAACGPPPETANRSEDEAAAAAATATAQPEMEEEVVPTAAPAEESAAAAVDVERITEFSYEVLEEGTGEMPEEGDYVLFHFIGTLANGTEIVNTYTLGEPLALPVGQSIFFEGWDLAAEQMSFGERGRAEIPAELGFGPQGAGSIPPDSDLIFEMELVGPIDITYEEVEEGSGEQAQVGDTVAVHYTGQLEDGTVFDSSEGGEPIRFVLGQGMVIPGWDIGIGRMREGGKAILTIPPELGYGAQGAGGVIPPNATLIFDVELVEVERVTE